MATIIKVEEKDGRSVLVFETDPPSIIARVPVPKGYALQEGKKGYTLAAEDGGWSVSGPDAAMISMIIDADDGDLDDVRAALQGVHENALTSAILLPPDYAIWPNSNGTVTLSYKGKVVYYGTPDELDDALFEQGAVSGV